MKFVADEGVDLPIVVLLRTNGHDVIYIVEESVGIDDETVLKIANEDGRILITRDKDFGELVFRYQKIHSGIILNRLYMLGADAKADIVASVIDRYGEELTGCYIVIQPGKIRIRKLKG